MLSLCAGSLAGCSHSAEPARGTAGEPVSETSHPVEPMPAAVDVCVGPLDALRRVRAVPSRAGVFDPGAPIQGEHLNWMVEGVGCVTYPALSGAVTCEGASLPWVATTLCQQ